MILPECYPFVKWAGGKRQVIPQLSKYVPRHFEQYFEPFVGGGPMYFHLAKVRGDFKAYLSDLNSELISAYKVLKTSSERLADTVKNNLEEFGRAEATTYYYKLRSTNPSDKLQKASRFILLNRTCYNGLYRVNKKSEFNVPFGGIILKDDTNNLINIGKLLRYMDVHLLHCDYRRILKETRKGDFIYLDPPYSSLNSAKSYTSYTQEKFKERKQLHLAEVFKKLDRQKCKILLSNSDTPLIRKLYKKYSVIEIKTSRSINSDAAKRTGHTELLIRNSF